MKKIILALMIAVSSALVLSCTEEEIAPKVSDNGGGGESVIMKK